MKTKFIYGKKPMPNRTLGDDIHNRPGKSIRADRVIRHKMKRRTIRAEDLPEILSPDESLIKFIREEKQVSYQSLQAHYSGVPETTLRSRMYALTRVGVLKREKCLCGQGWIYQLNK